MEISRRSFGRALLLSGSMGMLACSSRKLRAGGYQNVELEGGLATLRLPDNFLPLREDLIRKRSRLIGVTGGPSAALKGDVLLDLLQMNYWAVSHVFGLEEGANAEGRKTVEGLLLLSRMADVQSFAPLQAFFETGQQFCPDTRWSARRKLEWKTQPWLRGQQEKRYRFHEAEVAGLGFAIVVEDREKLLEGLVLASGPQKNVGVIKEILREATGSYILRQPLDSYFRQAGTAAEAMAKARRVRYLELLERLQAEGLDYSPTPRVVRFNPNLVCRFYWPPYDRSGVPLEIAFAARLGYLRRSITTELSSALSSGKLFSLAKEEQGRIADLAREAGWGEEGVAVAGLSFSFSDAIPDLSLWLDQVEAVSKEGLRLGVWEVAD